MKTAEKLNLCDEQLVKKYLRGDNNSLGILYNRYYSKVYYKCLSFTHNQDDAFDLAQDVLVKAFSNIGSFKGSSKFSTWLFSVTQNHCISQNSKSNKEYGFDVCKSYNLIAGDMDEDEFESRRRMEDLELNIDHYLARLPESDRRMLELKYYHDYSVIDLQNEFNLSLSAVKMRLLRARKRIRQLILEKQAA